MPLFVCLFWMIILSLMSFRTDSYWAIMVLLLFTSVAVFANSVLGDFTATTKLKNYAILIKQVTTTSLVPLSILFIRRIRKISREQHPLELMWIVAPIVLGTSAVLLYVLGGDENITMLMKDVHRNGEQVLSKYVNTLPYIFFIFTQVLYTAVVAIEVIWLFVYFIVLFIKEKIRFHSLFGFFFKKERIKTLELQVFFMLVLFVVFSIRFISSLDLTSDFPVWSVVISILICLSMSSICYVAMFGSKRTITLREMGNAWRYNYNKENKQKVVEEMMADLLEDAEEEALLHIQAKIGENLHVDQFKEGALDPARAEQLFSTISKSWEEDDLFRRFQHLMIDEKLFLQPKLTLIDISEMLGSNTTYVSKMVNNAYNLGFPELVNTLRVDYAEQYILNHRDAKQNEIAEKCGFLSASSFNTIFKRITGVTPKIWVASAELQNKVRQ